MYPSEYRRRGWWYVLVGIALFAGGIGMSVGPDATRLYLGAILVGAAMIARGMFFLDRYYRGPRLADFRGPTGTTAAEIYAEDIQQGFQPVEVNCEACSHDYVYFPGKAAQAQAAALGPEVAHALAAQAIMRNCALAPCPQCGRIQADMRAAAWEQAPVPFSFFLCLFSLFGCAMGFVATMSMVTDRMQTHIENPKESVFWMMDVALLALGVGLGLGCWIRARGWDPNQEDAEKRLRLAHRVSLSRDEYQKRVSFGLANLPR